MSEDSGLYQHVEQLTEREEKAFLFFTWTQAGLVLGGLLLGTTVAGWLKMQGGGYIGVAVGGVVLGAILAFVRVEHVPLYANIWVLLRYWFNYIRRGKPSVLRGAELWPAEPPREWGQLFWEGATGPLVQIGKERAEDQD